MPQSGSAAARLDLREETPPLLPPVPAAPAAPAAAPPASASAPAQAPAWLGWLRSTLGRAPAAEPDAPAVEAPLLVPGTDAAVAAALAALRASRPAGAALRALHWAAARNTVWLARLGLDVLAIEARPDWVSACAARLQAIGLAGRVRLVAPAARHGPALPAAYAEAAAREAAQGFDLVLADGALRRFCLAAAPRHVAPGGLLVLDDAEARDVAAMAARLEPFCIGRFANGVWTSMLFRAPPGGLPALS